MSSRSRTNERDKNEKIRQLREVMGVSEAQARQALQSNDWVIERAIGAFCEDSSSHSYSGWSTSNNSSQHSSHHSQMSTSKFDRKKIDQLWTTYADPREPNKMNLEQLLRFVQDLQFDPSERQTLVLCWKLNASKQGELQRNEFTQGCQELQCDTLEKLREKIKQLNKDVDNENEKFKSLYIYTFNFARSSTSARNLDVQPAIAYWKMLFGISLNSKASARFKFFDLWLKFLEERSNQRSITKDTWDLLYEFFTTIKSDFSNYDHDGAWPTLIDEFVDFVKTSQAHSSTVHV